MQKHIPEETLKLTIPAHRPIKRSTLSHILKQARLTVEDPDDNKFIECAIASQSKLIVSGDKHLLKISGYKDIKVLKPRQFVDNYLK